MRTFPSIILVLIFTAAATAQTTARSKKLIQSTGFPNYCGESLDCLIGDAKVVVRANILSIRGDDVDASVRETVKGDAAPGSTITFCSGGWPFNPGEDVVLPLVDERYERKAAQYLFVSRPIVFGQRPYYAMDLKPLNSPGEIMATVREL